MIFTCFIFVQLQLFFCRALHSKRELDTLTEATEDNGIIRILWWVARDIMRRADSFKPQEISNR